MIIGVDGPIFTHKNIKGYTSQRYLYHNIWKKHIVAIIHIYGARAILLLLYDNLDTESQSRDIIIDVSGPILTHKNIKASMGQQYIYHTIWEKIVAILHIYGARAIFLLFGDHQDSGSESCELVIGVAGPILTH